MKNAEDKISCLIGIQLDMKEYQHLVPMAILDAPYQLSMISLYDADFNEIWNYKEGPGSQQDHGKAQEYIQQLWTKQGGQYV